MKKLLIAALLLFPLSALAADKPQTIRYANPGYDWSGFYVGLQGGYNFSGTTSHPFGSFDNDGWLGGIYGGVNRQYGNWVLGLEGEWNWSSIKGSQAIGPVGINHEVNSFGAATTRLGHAFGPYLLYGRGGVAIANPEATVAGFNGDANHIGWTAGAGVEMMWNQAWSMRLSYDYFDFGSANYAFPIVGPIGVSVPADINFHTVRAGVAYRF
jgi:outer membrane immunogenic protein